MSAAELTRLRDRVIEQYGPWTAHAIHLGDGVYTADLMGSVDARFRRVVQVAADLAGVPITGLRIADLAAGEGGFAVEFAQHGARVVAIEGREANVAKARFAKEVLGLHTLEVVHDDIRNFNRDRYGSFEVVLAIGIVYHVDVPEIFDLLRRVADTCTRLAIIDTETAWESQVSDEVAQGDYSYRGARYVEPTGDPLDRDVLWSSMGNARSMLPTRASLANALLAAGFTSVFECHVPPVSDRPQRTTLVAMRGVAQSLSHPRYDQAPVGSVREYDLVLHGQPEPPLLHRLWRCVPITLRRDIKRRIGLFR